MFSLIATTHLASGDTVRHHPKRTPPVPRARATAPMESTPSPVPLSGGNSNRVERLGNLVRRKAGPWSPRVHEFLQFLHGGGFSRVPTAIGFDGEGNELLTYLEGEVGNYPLSAQVCSESALVSAAETLRQLHDASTGFLPQRLDGWMFPAREPVEVVCHGDYAPYNCVFRDGQVVGVIDFDGAHPGPRRWDVAYAVYRFGPMTAPTNRDGFGTLKLGTVGDQSQRVRRFCDAYRLGEADRADLPSAVVYRLESLVDLMRREARCGHAPFQRSIDAGHDALYERDADYVRVHADEFRAALTR